MSSLAGFNLDSREQVLREKNMSCLGPWRFTRIPSPSGKFHFHFISRSYWNTTDFKISPFDLSDLAFGQGAGSNIAIALQCLESFHPYWWGLETANAVFTWLCLTLWKVCFAPSSHVCKSRFLDTAWHITTVVWNIYTTQAWVSVGQPSEMHPSFRRFAKLGLLQDCSNPMAPTLAFFPKQHFIKQATSKSSRRAEKQSQEELRTSARLLLIEATLESSSRSARSLLGYNLNKY